MEIERGKEIYQPRFSKAELPFALAKEYFEYVTSKSKRCGLNGFTIKINYNCMKCYKNKQIYSPKGYKYLKFYSFFITIF